MNLKEQLEMQSLYSKQASAGKNDIERRDEVIEDLKRQVRNATVKDIVVKGKK